MWYVSMSPDGSQYAMVERIQDQVHGDINRVALYNTAGGNGQALLLAKGGFADGGISVADAGMTYAARIAFSPDGAWIV